MVIVSLLHLVSFIIYVWLTLFMLMRNPRAILNRVGAAMMICFSVWSLSAVILHSSLLNNEEDAVTVMEITSPAWLLITAFFVWFAALLTGRTKMTENRFFLPLLFVPPAAAFIILMTGNGISGFSQYWYGWIPVWKAGAHSYFIYSFYGFYMLSGLAMLFDYSRRAPTPERKAQAGIIFITGFVSFVVGAFADIFMPFAGKYWISDITSFVTLIWAAGIAYTMFKYKLLSMSPQMAYDNILSMMTNIIILAGSDGKIIYSNKAAAVLGYGEDGLKDKTLKDIFSEEDLQKKLPEKILSRSYIKSYEGGLKMKSGKILDIEFSTQAMKDPLTGGLEGIVIAANDVTQFKLVMNILSRAEAEKTAILNSMHEAITHYKPDGTILWTNILGAELAESDSPFLQGKTSEAIWKNRIDPAAYKPAVEMVRDNEYSEQEITMKDGKIWSIKVQPIKSYDKAITGVVESAQDISRRKQSEVELEKTINDLGDKMAELDSFAYVASHDLKEPLRTISNFLELLKRRYSGKLGEDADDFIRYSVDGAIRMYALVDALYDYSRVEKSFKISETDFDVAVENVNDSLAEAIAESKAKITHSNLPVILADKVKIRQLFQNLIANAIKFQDGLSGPPQVNISAQKQEKSWIFSVADNGLGIDEQYRKQIFEMFKRLNGEKFPGTGAGLTICRKIIEQHHGKIWVEANEPKGTIVKFSIPE